MLTTLNLVLDFQAINDLHTDDWKRLDDYLTMLRGCSEDKDYILDEGLYILRNL